MPSPPKTSDQGLPPTARQLRSSSLPPPTHPTPGAALCQRLNKRLRPLDARPVTSPIHKTRTGCQAGAARAVVMETANPAPELPSYPQLRQSPAGLGWEAWECPPRGRGRWARVTLPPRPTPLHQAHSSGHLGGFFTASSPPQAPSSRLGKEFRFQLCCRMNLVESWALSEPELLPGISIMTKVTIYCILTWCQALCEEFALSILRGPRHNSKRGVVWFLYTKEETEAQKASQEPELL